MASRKKSTKPKSKKPKLEELAPEPNPQAPVDSAFLVSALQPLRKKLEEDLLARAKASPQITQALKKRHAEEKAEERTADAFAVWQRRFVEQVAAAWILSCVFVRTLEDRDLLEQRRIAGPGALDTQRVFLQLAPSLSEREYLLTVFREMTRLHAARPLFDDHNPVWMLAPSATGAQALLQFFRTGSHETPALRFGQPDTRFLGDLYQDLNENVRKRYALLQTPDFIEAFILDRTLEPAIEKFGLEEADLIDPTCGSGHFLLGAFDRFFDHIRREKPALSKRQAATEALDKVYGADINPFAVAIAKFRLTLSFLEKGGFKKLSEAPKLPLHVAVADSLLYNPQHKQTELAHIEGAEAAKWEKRAFSFENEDEARAVLHRQYAAVVGNPPYITVKDEVLRNRYRELYRSVGGKYSLSAPFCERIFQLARTGGRTGQITANSFMKRGFGKKLIQQFLPSINLDLIVNTSGAYIPGHGTPTVLLFGSNERPQRDKVAAVLAKRGEPCTPADPAKGLVWSSIAKNWSTSGFENEFISVALLARDALADHPWSLAGGGAGELKDRLEARASRTLRDVISEVGFMAITGEDDVYVRAVPDWLRFGAERDAIRAFGIGQHVRDWSHDSDLAVAFPYRDGTFHDPSNYPGLDRLLWPFRTVLARTIYFGEDKAQRGMDWREFVFTTKDRLQSTNVIAFAFVATHNHFVLDRGGKVFKQSAPIIKLPDTATEEDHLALLAYLNSSTACFWMKQVFYPKGGDQMGDGGRLSATPWLDRYEFAGTGLKSLPLPPQMSVLRPYAEKLCKLASVRLSTSPAAVISKWAAEPSGTLAEFLSKGAQAEQTALEDMVRAQEALDWRCYELFGLAAGLSAEDPNDRHGCRAFEMRTLEQIDATSPDLAWFTRSGAPTEAPSASKLQQQRNEAVAERPELGLLETLDCKRWWRRTDYMEVAKRVLVEFLLQRIELRLKDAPLRSSHLSSSVRGETKAGQVFDMLGGDEVLTAIDNSSVPFLAALRLTATGMDKHREWETCWDKQRAEDAGQKAQSTEVPPKYKQADFRSGGYWKLRGKLDVPKERFISYPGCESDEDGEPIYGWAGWDHAQRAQALVSLYNDRKDREGWPKERLIPMLAGLLELLPWLKQWHDAPMPEYDTTFFEAYDAFLNKELRTHKLTREDLRAWRPDDKKKKSTRKKKKS